MKRSVRSESGQAVGASRPQRKAAFARASIGAVAQLARVSNATVSRVVNGLTGKVSEATRQRVQAAVETLDYRPSRAGSALRSGRSQIVALVIPDRFNTYNQALAASLERAVRQSGRIMVLCTTDESPAMQDEVLREMRSQLACGIVILGAVDSPGLRRALPGGEPIVLVNRRFGGRLRAPFVGVDDAIASAAVADRFVARGLLRPVVFHGPLFSSATRDRVRGFCERFREIASPSAPIACFELGAFSKEEGYARAGALLSAGTTFEGVFCTSDEVAYGVARACREAGQEPGRDVTIFGFDGSPINEFLAPWLSTVQVAYDAYGPAIVSLLQGYWSGRPPSRGSSILVPHTIADAQDATPTPTPTVRNRRRTAAQLPKR